MSLVAKLGFVHRQVWQRDGTSRAAVVLGPPPLLGILLAAAVWVGVHGVGVTRAEQPPPPWAHPPEPVTAPDAPITVAPIAALPAAGRDGIPVGYMSGWAGSFAPVENESDFDVNVLPQRVGSFPIDQPTLDADRIAAAAPANGHYVGVAQGELVIRIGGSYDLSVRFDRVAMESSECLVRVVLGHTRLVSTLEVNGSSSVSRSYDPVSFDLQPGLYGLATAFGCWHDGRLVGPGQVTILIRPPGSETAHPLAANEILRPSR